MTASSREGIGRLGALASASVLPRYVIRRAVRNLLRARLRNALTVVGIAIGTTLLVLMLALLEGIQGIAERDLLGSLNLSSVTIFRAPSGERPTDDAIAELRSFRGVAEIRRTLTVPARLTVRQSERPTQIVATELEEPEVLVGVQVGDVDGVTTIAAEIARRFGSTPGDAIGQVLTVRALTTNPNATPSQGRSDHELTLRVVGVRPEDAGTDAGGLYVSMNTALEALRATDGISYSSLVLTADTPTRAVELVHELSLAGFGAVALKTEFDRAMNTFAMVRLVLFVIGGIAIVVAALGVANTMLMAVLERTREIGILRSIGATTGYVRAQFLSEAALLGASGGAVGVVVGSLTAGALGPPLRAQLESIGGSLSSGAIFVVTPGLVAVALLGGTTVSVLAAWPSSERAARLEPAASLRYE